MSGIKKILPLLLAGALLTGCGEKIYSQAVESLENQNYAAAEEQFREAVEKEENIGDSYRGIGIACMEQEKYEEAVEAFSSALDNHAPETAVIYNMMGACSMRLEKYEDAIAYYEKGVKVGGSAGVVMQEMKFNIIVAYEKLERWEEAKQQLDSYVQEYPDDEAAAKEAAFLQTRISKE